MLNYLHKHVAILTKVALTWHIRDNTIFSLSNAPMTPWVIDTHARVVVSKFYGVTKMQTKKTWAHFSRVSFCEILKMPSSQHNFCTNFNLTFSFLNQNYEIVRFLRILWINFSFLQIKVMSQIVFTRLPNFKIFHRG